ncbi:phage tail tape measure protein [Bacillus sp. FSL K6-3431]|uniref:phage tail tape measure protein n=1 Tax=Bacillus sp. FSL K6-3431 TaxID=2921500 RepID=UPI0030F912B6
MTNDILVKVGADITNFSKNMADANKSLTNFGKANKETFDAFKGVGAAVTAGGAAIAVGLGAAVKTAVDFESAFAGVRKTVDASPAEFAELEQGIRAMAKELPASAAEIAGVAEAAGQLGIKREDILKFSRVMVDLGESTNMNAEEAAMSLARLANITQMPMDQIDRLGSTVVDLGNNLATTEGEIVAMGLRIAGAGHQIGLTEAQIMAIAGSLSSVGIEAEAGKHNCPVVWKQAA